MPLGVRRGDGCWAGDRQRSSAAGLQRRRSPQQARSSRRRRPLEGRSRGGGRQAAQEPGEAGGRGGGRRHGTRRPASSSGSRLRGRPVRTSLNEGDESGLKENSFWAKVLWAANYSLGFGPNLRVVLGLPGLPTGPAHIT